MVDCGPPCAVPSYTSAPTVGFGSAGGLGYGGLGYGYGGAERAANLGVLAGVVPSCINQNPSSEVVIQPPASIVTIPGAILSASCEPVAVGGNTPCAVGGSGLAGGYGYGGWGYGSVLLGGNFSS